MIAPEPTECPATEIERQRAFEDLLAHIRRERGMDYTQYKTSFLHRRLAVRMRVQGMASYPEYLSLLQSVPTELDALLSAFNINLSYFFRDETVFDALRHAVLAPLIARRSQDGFRRLSIWSAGCASGEEAYSTAIILVDLLGKDISHWDITIYGSDVDQATLARAHESTYDESSFQNLEAEFIDRCFVRDEDRYILRWRVKRLVTFAQQDLATPPPLPTYDLILCRNVLIYFAREHQERIVLHLLDHVDAGGHLVLGMTEMLPLSLTSRLEIVDGRLRIYRKPAPERGL